MREMSGRSLRLCVAAGAAALCGCSTAVPTARAASRSATFISTGPLQPRPKRAKAGATMPRRAAGSNRAPAAGLPSGCALVPRTAWAIEPRLFPDVTPRARSSRRMTTHETRPAPGLSHHQGGDDRRHRIHHPQHLGQGRRHDAPRHRPQVTSGLDWRSAAAGGPRRAALAVPEEVCRHRAQEIAFAPARSLEPPLARGFFMRFPDWLGTAASPSRAGTTVASSPSTGFGGSLLLEGCLEQADLPLDRIAAIEPGGDRMHGGIEPAHRPLQRLGALDQGAQALRQEPDVLLVAVLAACELHLGLLPVGLGERHFALLDRAVEQKP